MNKYIDAEALKKEIAKAPVWTALTITEKIGKAPSIDIEPKRGEWIDRSGGIEGAWNYCSVCGEQAIDLYDFCPNCGADMRERKESE